MDATLLGIIIGSAVSFLGSFMGHWFTMRREEKQWERQQKAEKEKRIWDLAQEKKQSILNAYHNCINALSLYIGTKFNNKDLNAPEGELLNLYREAYKWLSLIALTQLDDKSNPRGAKFHSSFRYFSESSDPSTARSLRDQVIELAMRDPNLFPGASVQTEDVNGREITIQIDEEYRQSQFYDGIELPKSFQFRVRFEDLTTEQPRKFWEIYYATYKEIPRRFGGLPLPVYSKENNQIILSGKDWEARVNPFVTTPQRIISAWEIDFDKALELAQLEQSGE